MQGTIASLMLMLVGMLISCSAAAGDGGGPAALKGQKAPDFSLKTTDDKTVKLSDQQGSVVVLDFWATWCPPCRMSLPHLQKVSTDKALADKGLKVFSVNARESLDDIKPFMEQNKYTFKVLMDSTGDTMGTYHIDGIPTTVIIDKKGIVQDVFVGYGGEQTATDIDNAITKALAAQ